MSDDLRPHSVVITGNSVRCQHCAYDQFLERKALLNTAGLTFFNLEWANQSARLLVCARCGFLHWFVPSPRPLLIRDASEPVVCPSCDGTIPAGATRCASCGWSYEIPEVPDLTG